MTFPASDYLDLNHTEHRMLFDNAANVWDALKQITSYLQFRLKPAINGRLVGKPFVSGAVFVGKGTVIEQGAMIKGPAWIGDGCEIRNGCYIRENVIIDHGSIVANSSEFKNSVLFEDCEVPHFNYVGDSLLGHKAHLGAGAVLSNWRLDHHTITIPLPDGSKRDTGLPKFGAVVGDHVDIGCNCTISPGSLLGRHSVIYPNTHWRGVLEARRLVKLRQSLQVVELR